MPIRIGIVGAGKIARDQHIPALVADPDFELVACVTHHEPVVGIANFTDVATMLEQGPALDAVTICTPPQAHFGTALAAIRHGKHVFLEKPPCETTDQLHTLVAESEKNGRVLFQSWHARHAAGVATARQWLNNRTVTGGHITWKEDVRFWHPGQTWIWQAGGFGVFDPGINALSILTCILPQAMKVKEAALLIPANSDMPIAADLTVASRTGTLLTASFDFRHAGVQTWDIVLETDFGSLKLTEGGAKLFIAEEPIETLGSPGEYPSLYRHFAALIRDGKSDVDSAPFDLVLEALRIGRRRSTEPFIP